TPYEILTGRKPDLSNIHPWGCKVRVHDASGSKLDGRSKIGRWMGLDVETQEGHRVYWPERRIITVERSVKFNFDEDDIMVKILPLEGEIRNIELQNAQPEDRTSSIEEIPDETPNVELNVDDVDMRDVVEPIEGRGKRIRKESEYVRMLREGAGVSGERRRANLLPKGVQIGSEIVAEVAVEDYAMASVTQSSEGIEPTYDEARRRPDWPR
ncbi:hypothetical protein BYT27DRAFT_7053013, partial [Phlegmacium glaucopus]